MSDAFNRFRKSMTDEKRLLLKQEIATTMNNIPKEWEGIINNIPFSDDERFKFLFLPSVEKAISEIVELEKGKWEKEAMSGDMLSNLELKKQLALKEQQLAAKEVEIKNLKSNSRIFNNQLSEGTRQWREMHDTIHAKLLQAKQRIKELEEKIPSNPLTK
jgi:predicted RNase H-like nuclease (RuvC/YqgF family)